VQRLRESAVRLFYRLNRWRGWETEYPPRFERSHPRLRHG